MKNVLVLVLLVTGMAACKSKKGSSENTAASISANHTGVVSHEQKKNGCSAVIKVDGADNLVLIPKDGLGKFDKDGLKISFNYTALRMPMPEGCSGMMAEVTDISERK